MTPAVATTANTGMPSFLQDQPARPQQATLAVNNVKKIWGEDPAQQQESKPTEAAKSTPQTAQATKVNPVEVVKKEATSKKDKKKEKTMNALFAGVSTTQKDSSSDEEKKEPPKKSV